MRIYSFSGLGVTGITALLSFILIPAYGVSGFVMSNVCAHLLTCLYIILGARVYRYFKLSAYQKQNVKELLKYSVPLIPNASMWWLVSASNRPFLEAYYGTFAIGILAVASKFPAFINILLGAFNTSWQISVLEEYKKENFQQFFNKGLQYFAFVLITACCILTCCSEWVTRIFTSNIEYHKAWIYIPMLAISTVLSCMSGLVGSIFSAYRKSKYYFYSSIWAAATALIANMMLIPTLGVWGAVIASVMSMTAMLCCRVLYARKFIRISDINKYISLLAFFLAYLGIMLGVRNRYASTIGIIGVAIVYMYAYRSYFWQLLVPISTAVQKHVSIRINKKGY